MSKKVKIIGHRGASGYEPENTLISFQKAIDLNADMVELDVYKCKTNQLVVSHTNIIKRGKTKHNLENMALQSIKRIKLEKGQKIPTLEEVLDLIDARVEVNIELKGSGTVTSTFETIEKYVHEKGWSYDDFLVSAFDFDRLHKFNDLDKESNGGDGKIRFSILVRYGIGGVAKYANYLLGEKKPYSVNPSLSVISKSLVKNAHEKGLKVYSWEVDTEDKVRRVLSYGVDGIFADCPDKAREWVRNYRKDIGFFDL